MLRRQERIPQDPDRVTVFLVKASGVGVPYPVAFIAGTVNFSRQEQAVWKLLGVLWVLLGIIIIIRKKGFLAF